ncbi:NAD-dependent epimerase/dehydratase family protein [Nocardia xishanensis]|uniref:NAD-dependent epimerase/dehydratase family protein n=1 Tax=Nocardia xishanensis TaxID=238964 RepID=UPI0008304E2E|nr:NAD-dependent epimerase/dehydratase family protein [Nocardia xishanensis]
MGGVANPYAATKATVDMMIAGECGTDHPTTDGTCVRDYVHVSDLAAAHLLALEALSPGRYEVFNLGNGDGYSNRQMLDTVREVTGRAFPVYYADRRPGDPAVCVANSDKAAAELGWKPQRPNLSDIVADAWEFHRTVHGIAG